MSSRSCATTCWTRASRSSPMETSTPTFPSTSRGWPMRSATVMYLPMAGVRRMKDGHSSFVCVCVWMCSANQLSSVVMEHSINYSVLCCFCSPLLLSQSDCLSPGSEKFVAHIEAHLAHLLVGCSDISPTVANLLIPLFPLRIWLMKTGSNVNFDFGPKQLVIIYAHVQFPPRKNQ